MKSFYQKYLHNSFCFCLVWAFILNLFIETLARKWLGGIMFIVAPYIHNLYSLNEAAIEALERMIRIKSVLLPIYVINVCTFFILRAGGDTWSTLLFDSVFLWFGQVLVSTLLSMFTPISLVTLYVTNCLRKATSQEGVKNVKIYRKMKILS